MRSYKRNGGEPSSAPAVTRSSPATSAWRSSLLPASRRTPAFRSSTGSRRVRRNNGCAAGARCSPPGSVLSRAHIYGYGRSLRPPQGTSIARRRRAPFRQTLLPTILVVPQGLDRAVAGIDHRPCPGVLGLGPPHVREGIRHLARESSH